MRVEIDTSLAQLFTGTRLPSESTCIHCNHSFDADDRCSLLAICPEGASAYTLSGLSCPSCAHQTISSPTLGYSEYLLATRLTTTAHSNDGALILSDVHTIQTSPPSEGSAITDGPVALVPTADLPELTNTTYHIERDDEQRTPLCNCSSDTDYTRVAFADLETPSARCCRTCLTVYQNDHCSLRGGPHHAQAETADSPPDPAIGELQRARRHATGTSAHSQQE
ncbi:hypothetical protein HAPAU_40590 [Halalkalicoccus paucihalophilus]|uniref:DUF8112 domain-containing protein n=1 Tax=Halalkalicoccus paucihalophilus TaxID=1008153 RepID=A0A151A8U2_9EURY|nr:hypothetical protein HAPAU_40590 [Halalkalicoccus paucihalophilus]